MGWLIAVILSVVVNSICVLEQHSIIIQLELAFTLRNISFYRLHIIAILWISVCILKFSKCHIPVFHFACDNKFSSEVLHLQQKWKIHFWVLKYFKVKICLSIVQFLLQLVYDLLWYSTTQRVYYLIKTKKWKKWRKKICFVFLKHHFEINVNMYSKSRLCIFILYKKKVVNY